jgi:hypothetical protein
MESASLTQSKADSAAQQARAECQSNLDQAFAQYLVPAVRSDESDMSWFATVM